MVNVWNMLELGDLIERLSKVNNPAATVCFDFCRLKPTKLDSYRGYYDFLALGFVDADQYPTPKHLDTANELLAECKSALGKTFHGYKGGEYRMHAKTPIFVDNWGQCFGTGLVDVKVDRDVEGQDWRVILMTGLVDQ